MEALLPHPIFRNLQLKHKRQSGSFELGTLPFLISFGAANRCRRRRVRHHHAAGGEETGMCSAFDLKPNESSIL